MKVQSGPSFRHAYIQAKFQAHSFLKKAILFYIRGTG